MHGISSNLLVAWHGPWWPELAQCRHYDIANISGSYGEQGHWCGRVWPGVAQHAKLPVVGHRGIINIEEKGVVLWSSRIRDLPVNNKQHSQPCGLSLSHCHLLGTCPGSPVNSSHESVTMQMTDTIRRQMTAPVGGLTCWR